MKKQNPKESPQENSKEKPKEKNDFLKYFLAGLVVAGIIYAVITLTRNDNTGPVVKKSHVWSAETDSLFVNNCYGKYKPQIKDDMGKQEITKAFCRCMLEKVKMQYEERDIDKVRNDQIIIWDGECRAALSDPGFLR